MEVQPAPGPATPTDPGNCGVPVSVGFRKGAGGQGDLMLRNSGASISEDIKAIVALRLGPPMSCKTDTDELASGRKKQEQESGHVVTIRLIRPVK